MYNKKTLTFTFHHYIGGGGGGGGGGCPRPIGDI